LKIIYSNRLAFQLPGMRSKIGCAYGVSQTPDMVGSASAEDLAGHRRSKFQRYLVVWREWPVWRPGEDHRVPPGLANAAIYDNMDAAPRHAANSVCTERSQDDGDVKRLIDRGYFMVKFRAFAEA
jgi:hypothetical protein